MSDSEQKTGEMPAVGASGATNIRPNGYFAKLMEGNAPMAPPQDPPSSPPSPGSLPDRG